MVALGIAFFVGLLGSMDNLRLSIDRPYRDLRFADFTVSVAGAPSDAGANLQSLPGVANVTGRINVEVPVSFPGKDTDVIVARILSLPVSDRPAVDDILVTSGTYLAGDALNDTLIEQNFATHHGLAVGDRVEVQTPAGAWTTRVAGIAISPEYLWPARTPSEHMPDVLRRWGVIFLSYDTASRLFGFNGSVNEFAVTIQPGADQEAVIREARDALAPFTVVSVVPRAEQPSEMILKSMVGALDFLSLAFPVLFLVVVALSTYVLLTRLVHTQRPQIGLLLALGYPRRAVLAHYLEFAVLIALLGSAFGLLGGYLLAGPVTDLFAERVSLPLVVVVPHWDVMALGVMLSLAFTSVAGLLPAYRASKENPATTLRGEVPRKGLAQLRHRPASHAAGKVTTKLPYRNLRRNVVRTAFSVLALGLAASLIIVPFGFLDTMDEATATSARISVFDLSAVLYRPVPENVSATVGGWDEIAAAESYLTIPSVIEGKGTSYNTVLYGLEPRSDLYRLFARDGSRVYVTGNGVLLASIFEKKGLRVGDEVTVGSLEVKVAGFLTAFSNVGFLPLETLQSAFSLPGKANGLFLRLSPGTTEDAAKTRLYTSLPVWSVTSVAKSLQDWTDMLRLFYGFIGVIVVFGLTLAGAIAFNAVTINVLERSREIATMRTLGVKGSTIARIMTVENLLTLGLSMVLGSLLGYLLTGYLMTLFSSDLFVLDTTVSIRTFILAAGLLVGALLVSEIPGLRYVQRMDLARATKERAG